ncbi:MAG: hypothetical protein M0Z70_07790 [Nitrospiraceae bacterium]|jgi:hypothetical protein|nr:hypothetical protein [Nitrospirota bacterium]MDA8339185.1 hypothetical protein [Nitrospiraceae bacterium]
MKKMICLIAVVLLSGIAYAGDPYNYAGQWNSWSYVTKNAYLTGLSDGIIYGGSQIHSKYTGTNVLDTKSKEFKKLEKAFQETTLYFENDALIKVIDELYEDSSNCFIPFHETAVIARDKLKGKSIEESLRKARQMAIELHEFIEKQTGHVGARFTGVLEDYYPWYLEPSGILPKKDAAEAIYNVFRNPLTHDLGLDVKQHSKGLVVKVKRLKTSTRGGKDRGLPEKTIESLEDGTTRPKMSATVTATPQKKVLLVEGLYWGIRVMIERLTADKVRMLAADKFLAKF